MEVPRILVVDTLLEPARQADEVLREILEKLQGAPSESLEIRGYFVLSVSQVEVALSGIRSYFARIFPEKVLDPDVRLSRARLVGYPLAVDILEHILDEKAFDLAYGRFADVLAGFLKECAINDCPIDSRIVETLTEAKATRNTLLHTGLRVNRRYIDSAGPMKRADSGQLPLTAQYVTGICEAALTLVQEVDKRLELKYRSYSKLSAIEQIWNWMFPTEPMHGRFNQFFYVDNDTQTILGIKHDELEGHLSHSEVELLGLWRHNVISPGFRSLDPNNQRKMLWFLETLRDFDLINDRRPAKRRLVGQKE